MELLMELTKTQEEVLDFIKDRCEKTGISPSFREIQKHFGYKAIGTVQDHVQALLKKGRLARPKGKARGLVPHGFVTERTKAIPIYGEIAAGSTREAEQLELGFMNVAASMVKDPCFALRVVGNSMIEIGILEGDVLLVEREAEIHDGDIVVALVDGETTVKRYRLKKGRIYLVPENKRMEPIEITTSRFTIQGKVVGLQRKIS